MRWQHVLTGLGLSCVLVTTAAAQSDTIRYPRLRPNGRLQLDAAFYEQDRNPLSNGVEARRARLAVGGDLSARLHFQLEADFADDNAKLRDAWLMYELTPFLRLQAGNFKENFTLEGVTSSLYLSFLERSLADDAFVPGRHLGAVLRASRPPFAGSIGFYGNEVGSEFGPELEESEPWGATARVAVAPLHAAGRVLHLGGDLRWRQADVEDDDRLFVEFSALSETHVDRTDLYNTGIIAGAGSYRQAAAEAAFVYGPVSVQGEYIWTQARRAARPAPVFAGGYVFLSVIATGESRSYDVVDGRFGNVTPARRALGAVELLVRYSRLNLNDDDIAGGAGHNWTAGLNWYPRPNTRVMLNYVFTEHDALATGAGEFNGGDDFNVFQFRVQYNF